MFFFLLFFILVFLCCHFLFCFAKESAQCIDFVRARAFVGVCACVKFKRQVAHFILKLVTCFITAKYLSLFFLCAVVVVLFSFSFDLLCILLFLTYITLCRPNSQRASENAYNLLRYFLSLLFLFVCFFWVAAMFLMAGMNMYMCEHCQYTISEYCAHNDSE